MNRHFIAAVAVATTVMTGACQRLQPPPASTGTSQPSTVSAPVAARDGARSIEAIGHHAEDLYDHAKAADWQAARVDMNGLYEAAALLGADDTAIVRNQLQSIDTAIKARDARAVMHMANDLTRRGTEMLRPYSPAVPADVALLDYYGREIEMSAGENDLPRLQATRGSIESIWSSLRESVTKRGGEPVAVRFDALVKKLGEARTATEFGAIATPILDEVDSLENVFTR